MGLPVLLDRTKPEKALSKPFRDEYVFRPAELNLKAGDHVRYWAAAEDNKEPRPNHAETPHWTIKIVGRGKTASKTRRTSRTRAMVSRTEDENGPAQAAREIRPRQGKGDSTKQGGRIEGGRFALREKADGEQEWKAQIRSTRTARTRTSRKTAAVPAKRTSSDQSNGQNERRPIPLRPAISPREDRSGYAEG